MASVFERVTSGDAKRTDKKNTDGFEYGILLSPGEVRSNALAALAAFVPATLDGIPVSSLILKPTESELLYYGAAEYEDSEDKDQEKKDPKEEGESAFTFDTTGGQEKITNSRQTMFSYGRDFGLGPITPPDFKGGINVTKTGIDGVEITVPKFTFELTRIFSVYAFHPPVDPTDWTLMETFRKLTGSVNDDLITLVTSTGIEENFQAGELRFDGVKGKAKSPLLFEVVYHFSFSEGIIPGINAPIVLGDITITEKEGWDYLWVFYEEKDDTTTHVITRVPMGAYIERVYRRTDFSLLRTGG